MEEEILNRILKTIIVVKDGIEIKNEHFDMYALAGYLAEMEERIKKLEDKKFNFGELNNMKTKVCNCIPLCTTSDSPCVVMTKQQENWTEEFDEEFVKDNGDKIEPSFKDPNGDVTLIKSFISKTLSENNQRIVGVVEEKLNTCLEGLEISDPMGYGNQRFSVIDVVERMEEVKSDIIKAIKE